MNKKFYIIIGYILLFFLAGGLLYHMKNASLESIPATVKKTEFIGEYSYDGEQWYPLTEATNLSALKGDLFLRGQFDDPENVPINFYLNHIGAEIYVEGESVYYTGPVKDDMLQFCSNCWSGWRYEGLKELDEIVIRLHNPHKYGNADAYEEFLDSFSFGAVFSLESYVHEQCALERIAGNAMIILSFVVIGIAIGYLSRKYYRGEFFLHAGLLLLSVGGYIIYDTIEVSFYDTTFAFNVWVRQICILFAVLETVQCVTCLLTEKRRKACNIVVGLLGGSTAVMMALSFLDVLVIYDVETYFCFVQVMALIIAGILSVQEWMKNNKSEKIYIGMFLVLILSSLVEFINAALNLWDGGLFVKTVMVCLILFSFVLAVRSIVLQQGAVMKAKEMERELQESYIAMAFSQIKPHFIYNVLSVIRSLCVENREKAVETIDHFSGYLRSSLESIDKRQCITFSEEMKFVDTYIYLEQQRFEDRIIVKKDIECDTFMIPPMTIQPIVENAVRHGIRKKNGVGTIEINCRTTDKEYCITVCDDGVGFDKEESLTSERKHIGLKNVEHRLALMCKGRIEVESVIGQGTKVFIFIPKV